MSGAMDEKPEEEKMPVTIVTGFLGAGKTTLVNHILTGDHGMKIAVIENEFGEISIDEELVADNMKTKENIISMDNGCVCCTVRGDLIRALAELNKRGPFDAVLLETTGLADPAPVAFSFMKSAVVKCNFKLDAILCLVDSKHVMAHLLEEKPDHAVNEAVQQVAFADKILLNKIDLVTPEELAELRGNIRGVNKFAELIECQNSKVDLKRLLGIGTFSVERSLEIDPTLMDDSEEEEEEAAPVDEGAHDGGHGHGHGHAEHTGEGECDEDCDGVKVHDGTADAHGHGGHGHGKAAAAHDKGHGHGHGHGHGGKSKSIKKVHDLSRVGSIGISVSKPLDNVKFNYFMGLLLRIKSEDLYRSKGVLHIADHDDTKFVFQGVHESINFGPALSPWKDAEKRTSKMVFIGKDLDKDALQQGFVKCLYNKLPEGWELRPHRMDGRPYYVHVESGKSQWEEPTL